MRFRYYWGDVRALARAPMTVLDCGDPDPKWGHDPKSVRHGCLYGFAKTLAEIANGQVRKGKLPLHRGLATAEWS